MHITLSAIILSNVATLPPNANLSNEMVFSLGAKEGLSAQSLREAVAEMCQGLIDAHLGGNVVKKRIALGGRGKSGGVRTVLAFKVNDKAFFLYGFAKNQRDNISSKELQALKLLAAELLAYDGEALDQAVRTEELIEVKYEQA